MDNYTKGLFAGRPVIFQLGILLAGVLAGIVSGTLVSLVIMQMVGEDVTGVMSEPVWLLQLTQFLSATLAFLAPACLTAWLCSKQPAQFLHLRGWPGFRTLLLAGMATLLISPTVSLAGYLNEQMQLPECLAPVENWMKASEDAMAEVVEKMLAGQHVVSFIINLIVIAVMAGVTEEFMFRGALLSIFRQKIRNAHAAIWIVAVIFSTIHLQFYGFLPRMLLGAYLGYLLLWTKNIWVPVFAHFLNNTVAIIALSDASLRDHPLLSEKVAPEDAGWLSAVAAVTLLAFVACMNGIYKLRIKQ